MQQLCNATAVIHISLHFSIPQKNSGQCNGNVKLMLWLQICFCLSETQPNKLTIQFVDNTLVSPGKYKDNQGIGDVEIDWGYEVIGGSAFYNSSITSVCLPGTLTTIENSAFMYCSKLTSFIMNENLTTMDYSVLARCMNLETLYFSSTIKSIGTSPFVGCDKAVVTVNSKNAHFAFEDGILYNKAKNTVYWVQNTRTELIFGPNALYAAQTGVQDCTILETVTWDSAVSIDANAFRGCGNLRNITIGNRCTFIHSSALDSCTNLNAIYIHENNTKYGDQDGVLMEKNGGSLNKIVLYPRGKKNTTFYVEKGLEFIDATAFVGSQVREFIVDTSSTKFASWKGIVHSTDFSIIYAVPTRIDNSKFAFHENVVEVADKAFYSVTGLTEINVPERVTRIGFRSFSNTNQAKVLTVGNSITYMGNECFSATHMSEFRFPSSLDTIPSNVMAWGYCPKVILPENTRIILYGAFGYSTLQEINFPAALERIDGNAFLKTSITAEGLGLCRNLEYIGPYAFKECMRIVNVTIPARVHTIDVGAFWTSSNLQNVVIENCATMVYYGAFYGAHKMFQQVCISTRQFTKAGNIIETVIQSSQIFVLACNIISQLTI